MKVLADSITITATPTLLGPFHTAGQRILIRHIVEALDATNAALTVLGFDPIANETFTLLAGTAQTGTGSQQLAVGDVTNVAGRVERAGVGLARSVGPVRGHLRRVAATMIAISLPIAHTC